MKDEFEKISEALEKFNSQGAKVVKNGSSDKPYCVIGKTGKNYGCYKTQKDAFKRLDFVLKGDFNEDGLPDIAPQKQKAEAHILKNGPPGKEYCVYSKTTNRKFGCYKTKLEAENRLAEIERFSK